MNTQLSREHLGLPPPLHVNLTDAGRSVGWVKGNVVGFRGFANEVEAVHAAWVAYRSLSRRLARRYGSRPIPIDIEPLAIQRSNDGDVILAGSRAIGTLIRPGEASPSGPDSFGFEVSIPRATDELTMRAKAYFVYRTLRKAGVRWALWRPELKYEQPQPELGAAAADAREATTGKSQHGNHQHGGENNVTQRLGQRARQLWPLSWRRSNRAGRGQHDRPAGVRGR